MAVDFKNFRKELYEGGSVFNSPTFFGEEVTFSPGDGGQPRTISVTITDAEIEDIDGEYVEYKQEFIWVSAARDPSCDVGGVDVPREKDRITRSGDPVPWTYQNQRREHAEHSWEMLYGRKRPNRVGPPDSI